LLRKVPSKSATAKKPATGEQIEADAPHDAALTIDLEAPSATPTPVQVVAAPAPEAPAPVAERPAEPVQAAPRAPLAVPANDSAPAPRAATPVPPRPMGPANGGQRPPGGIMQGGRVMPPPRPMAKAEQFAEGDHVVYPTHGVGKVERIATEEIAGHKLELIHITFEENRMTLRVPVAKARSAGLRKLASRKMFDEALAVLKGRARIKRTMWSRRAQEYEAKINSGDPLAIAEVVRDLHRNAGQPDQSFSERQIYEAAMDRLAAELGALDRIDKAAAAVKLAEFLKTV
jgi:CarD family transcriptional regulator